MFGSRKSRAPNPPPLNASPTNSSAASAAHLAFTRRESNNSSLSAAAAAAALRARPTTPTNVAEVQTKRTLRRASSAAETPDQHQRQLSRCSSSASMSERTFRRSPSPGARSVSSSSGGRGSYAEPEAPPVPAIPQSVNVAAAAKTRGGKKPKSLGITTTPVRTASQKAADSKEKGTWFGGAHVGDLGNVRASDAILSAPVRSPTVAQSQDVDGRPGSISPANFSYPSRVRLASPSGASSLADDEEEHGGARIQPPRTEAQQTHHKRQGSGKSPQRGGSIRSARSSSTTSDQTLVYDPNSRRMVPRAEILALEHHIREVSETRTRKKKSTPIRSGSHLARGTVSRTHGTAVDAGVSEEAQKAAAASLKSHHEDGKPPVHQETDDEEGDESEAVQIPVQLEPERIVAPRQTQYTETSSSVQSAREGDPEPRSPTTDSRQLALQRIPSVVREEEEGLDSESDAENTKHSATAPASAAALDAVPVRHSVYAHGAQSPPQSDLTEDQTVEMSTTTPVDAAAATTMPAPAPSTSTNGQSATLRREPRTQSKSPLRSAHFGPVQETLMVKHEPPSRSISPRKSALKQSSSPRGASPTGYASDVSAAEAVVQAPPVQRKKAARVSFDDENTVVVGESAGPTETESSAPPSPQQVAGKRPWYSTIGIHRKKDAVPLEDDEVMKPRPALPSFGSIRGRKQAPKAAEERPLVTPHEPPHEISDPESPQEKRLGTNTRWQSSDHAIGAVVSEHVGKNGANISKVREPLPPVATSVEGNGYTSSSDDESELLADTPKIEHETSQVSQASTLVPEAKLPNGSAETPVEDKDFGTAPTIAITQPSPLIEQLEQERSSYVHFPGEFPDTDTEADGDTVLKPARQAMFEPVVQTEDAAATAQTPSTVLATQHAVPDDMDDSDDSSIYSDAHEDLSDMEGDGFQSLDAVLEKPLVKTPPTDVLAKAEAARAEAVAPKPQTRESAESSSSTPQNEQQTADPWEAAKEYWRSLTVEKRAQLEKEASEEAAVEADLEEARPETGKPRRKKSVEQRTAEKKAIEQQRTAADTGRIKSGMKAAPEEYTTKAKHTLPAQQQNSNTKTETGSHLRKSMRGAPEVQRVDAGPRLRRSLRSDSTPVASTSRQRPTSHMPLGNSVEISGTTHTRSMSDTNLGSITSPAASNSIFQPGLRRRGSDSSVSSFKRSRPASSGFGFRKTMRTGRANSEDSLDQQQPPPSRLSLRTASPPVSMGSRMRTTLRGDAQPRQRRGSDDSGKGYLRFSGSFGRASDRKGKKGSSRFSDDSSDEDEGLARRFTSRFDDSSDDEVVSAEPLRIPRTMRGATGRKQDAPPSPPLPEEEEMSDDEIGPAPPAVDAGIVGGEEEKHPRVTTGHHRRSERPKSTGLMSSVLRRSKKRDGGISRPGLSESAARRDTTLERTASQLSELRNTTGGAGSPRLQKRSVSRQQQKQQQHAWPLGQEDESKRPEETSEQSSTQRSPSVLGHSKSNPSLNRPAFLTSRRTMSVQHMDSNEGSGTGPQAGATKKKKFGVLRRMFKLDE